MAIILCIETSTDVCSVCISDGKRLLAIRETGRSYSHNEVIAVFIDECVKEANMQIRDLEAVSISRGPGSYTALRIGTSTAKGICYALDIPLITVDTLKALALSVTDIVKPNGVIIPMIDARRDEVYAAVYDSSFKELAPVAPIILEEDTFSELAHYDEVIICGDGASKSKEILTLPNAIFKSTECSARYMIDISFSKFDNKLFEDIAYYEPHYYKAPNITVQKKNFL